MAGNNICLNGSGYRDDTAFRAICNVMRMERKIHRNGNKNKNGNSKIQRVRVVKKS